MAVHRQPATARDDASHEEFVGPRFRTLVPVEAPVADVDPGEALRRIDRAIRAREDWRREAWSWYDSWSKAVNDHVRRTYEAESRRLWAVAAQRWAAGRKAVDSVPDAFEAVPVHAIAREAAERYLRAGIRSFDPAEDVFWESPDGRAFWVGPVDYADPSRPALAGAEEHRRWWESGASIVREGFDTGTLWYEPPQRYGGTGKV